MSIGTLRAYLKFGSHIEMRKNKDGSVSGYVFNEYVMDSNTTPHLLISSALPFHVDLNEMFMEVIEKFSWRGDLAGSCRPCGEYRWKSAVAEVSVDRYGKTQKMVAHIEGKKLVDMSELYTQICAGLLHPVISYDAPMAPSPIRNIRQLLREIGQVIRRELSILWVTKVKLP